MLYASARSFCEPDEDDTVLGTGAYAAATTTLPVLVDTTRATFLGASSTVYAAYVDLLWRHPLFSDIYTGGLLLAMWTGNVLCALSSAEHYGAVTKTDIVAVTNVLVSLGVVLPLAGLAHDPELVREMMELTLGAALAP